MNQSTTLAATTIGVSALGILAYYGYQNRTGVHSPDEVVGENVKVTEEKTDNFQEQAKEEVGKVLSNVKGTWSSFWAKEYDDIQKEVGEKEVGEKEDVEEKVE